ncbi:MAG: radical SAM protein [Deltaproteobacteria bacterium]|nr:radical SAM protein [Deltaproteobacteria bacterium]
MDAIIIAGVSKSQGSQFSLKKGIHLTKDDEIMSYHNLGRHFGLKPASTLADYTTPYLGGIYLYNFLNRRGITCGLINFLDLELERFKDLLKQNPKIVALSTTFLTDIKSVKSVTRTIRQYAPDIKIVLGGPLVYNSYLLYGMKDTAYDTASCEQDFYFLNHAPELHDDIDLFVVEEQGETTLHQIITTINNRGDLSTVPNLASYDRDNQLTFSERKTEDNAFEEDLVDWREIPEDYLFPIFPLRGSRGCPYKCAYCNFCHGRKFRLKDIDIAAKEVSALADTGKVKIIRFTDDNLFLTREHVEQYCKMLIRSGKGLKWTSFIRANSITEDNVQLLKDSGCILAQIGMESGSKQILKGMNKKDSPENYEKVIELLNANGISTQLYFIVGFPGETQETIDETIQMINRFSHKGPGINHIMVFPFVLAPLSPIYLPENRGEYHLSGYMTRWKHDTMDFSQAYAYAKEFFLRCKNVYPFYGIDEFYEVDIAKLKEVAQLRMQIRKAEVMDSPEGVKQGWDKLRNVMTS